MTHRVPCLGSLRTRKQAWSSGVSSVYAYVLLVPAAVHTYIHILFLVQAAVHTLASSCAYTFLCALSPLSRVHCPLPLASLPSPVRLCTCALALALSRPSPPSPFPILGRIRLTGRRTGVEWLVNRLSTACQPLSDGLSTACQPLSSVRAREGVRRGRARAGVLGLCCQQC